MKQPPQTIFLIGFSGSGKSSVGERLAKRLARPFLDTDAMVSEVAGKTIPEIFSEDGERKFRSLEKETIAQACDDSNRGSVIALGGGAFEDAANRKRVLASGVVVYLRCSQDRIYRRMLKTSDRPMLAGSEGSQMTSRGDLKLRIRDLLAARGVNYEKAHVTVSTSRGTLQDHVSAIIAAIEGQYG